MVGYLSTTQIYDSCTMEVGVLERNGYLLRIQLARMAKYLEDPVWQCVQEEIMRREYGKIQSRERIRRLESHLSQQFELLKTKMEDAVAKVLTVQKKLIEQLGQVCVSFLPGFLISQYGEQGTEYLSQEDFVKRFSSKPAPAIVKELGAYLKQNLETNHQLAEYCCDSI